MLEFFARIWRVLKTALISIPVLIAIFILQAIFGLFGVESNFVYTTLGVALFVSLSIAVLNWFTCDLLNLSILDNVIGKIFKIFLYCLALFVSVLIQLYFASATTDYVLFEGDVFKDVLILTAMISPFFSLYFGYKASIDEDFAVDYHWRSVPYSVGGGLIIGIGLSIIFSILPFLQSIASWLIPVLSVGTLIVIMIICKSMPFIEFGYYSYRPSRSSYTPTYTKPSKKSIADSTAEQDWWNNK